MATIDRHSELEAILGGGPRHAGDRPLTIVELMRARTLDAELAALVWMLLEARVPLIVAAGPPRTGKSTVLHALLDFIPPGITRRTLDGFFEDFRWLPEAAELGWQQEWLPGPRLGDRSAKTSSTSAEAPARPDTTYLVAAELSDHLPVYTWGEQARIAVRALGRGYGLGATIHAESLEEVFAELGSWSVGLTPDELSWLGVVLVVRRVGPEARRVVAAHYVRPIARDAGGHLQRPGPAVLATWEPSTDRLEHFWWGIVPELTDRTGRRAGAFESEHERRSTFLQELAVAGVVEPREIRIAVDRFRSGGS